MVFSKAKATRVVNAILSDRKLDQEMIRVAGDYQI